MAIFSKIFELFENYPHKELKLAYNELRAISVILINEFRLLRRLQSRITAEIHGSVIVPKTGLIEIEKSKAIDDPAFGLIPRLDRLSHHASKRFKKVSDKITEAEPVSPEEKLELQRVIRFLREINEEIQSIKKSEYEDPKDKLIQINSILRDISMLLKKFYDIERHREELVRKIKEHEISPLLKRIYDHPNKLSKTVPILTATLKRTELRDLESEAERINACKDPRFFVKWRRWWRDLQSEEIDANTPLKDPHINVTIRLRGQKKKDIHLLLAA